MWNAFTQFVAIAKVELREDFSLFGRLAIPFDRFPVVLRDALARLLANPKIILCASETLICGCLIPLDCLNMVLWNAISVIV